MAKQKIKLMTAGKLDMTGLKKIGKSLLITLGAAAIGYIGNLAGVIDFGSAETLVATILPFIVNFLYKLLGTYESK